MSGWNEDSFLEEIMPLLKQKQGPEWCPNAETVCAVIDGSASDALRDAFAGHTAQCPACANLYERLRNFDRPGPPEQERQWQQTEKRLDIWLESLAAPPHRIRNGSPQTVGRACAGRS